MNSRSVVLSSMWDRFFLDLTIVGAIGDSCFPLDALAVPARAQPRSQGLKFVVLDVGYTL